MSVHSDAVRRHSYSCAGELIASIPALLRGERVDIVHDCKYRDGRIAEEWMIYVVDQAISSRDATLEGAFRKVVARLSHP